MSLPGNLDFANSICLPNEMKFQIVCVLPDCRGCLHSAWAKVVPYPLQQVSSKRSKSTEWGSSKELDQPDGMAWTLDLKRRKKLQYELYIQW